jgi:molybdenum cofactor biosynthesis enzyme MoaA
MQNKDRNKSETFCVLPWIHTATYTDGTALLCCVAQPDSGLNLNHNTINEVKNSEYFKKARLSLLNGEKFQGCSVCWREESVGVKSHRMNENHLWDLLLTKEFVDELVQNTHDDGTIENELYTLDFRLGNTCNLACVMCRPTDSSKWFNEAKKLANELETNAKWDWKHKSQLDITKFEWYKRKEFLEDFYESCGSMRLMIFAGGEPLLIKEHKEIIKEMVKRGYAKNIQVNYHTNGTIYDTELMELWKHFKKVELFISIDGIDKVTEYVRYPSKFSIIEKNLRMYDDNSSENMSFKILYTVQALNIFYLPEFADWLEQQNYKKIIVHRKHDPIFHTGVLWGPNYLSTKILPQKVKDHITKKLTDYVEAKKDTLNVSNFLQMVNLMNSEDNSSFLDQFDEYLIKMDLYRNLNHKETFKELLQLWHEY